MSNDKQKSRQHWIKQTIDEARKTVIDTYRAQQDIYARHWIRPPFALPEADFLTLCTRCDACIEACEYGVVFKLSGAVGPLAAFTPALDLMNRGCHLCADWPCVTSCDAGALIIASDNEDTVVLPVLARIWVDKDLCLSYQEQSCGVCIDVCPVRDLRCSTESRLSIDQELCLGCGMCREACIGKPKAIHIQSLAA